MAEVALTPDEQALLAEFKRREEQALLAVQCRASLYDFTVAAWHVLEPGSPFILNWHIKVICDHVQAVLEDWRGLRKAKIKRARMQNLLINIPPGTAKSRIVCVMAPAWMWLDSPEWRAIFFSGNESISGRDSMYRRDLIESDWYRKTFKPEWRLKDDQNAKLNFNNTIGGFLQAMTAGQRIIGTRADALFIDDPNDAQTVGSDDIRTKINEIWWDQGAANRVNEPSWSVRVGIMQRLHEDDWAGHVLKEEVNGVKTWWHLNIMQEFEPEARCPCGRTNCKTPLPNGDPRTESGELLFPARFSREILDQERERLQEHGYAGQHQQHPFPKGGGILKRDWFRYYDPTNVAQMKFDEVFQSWDMTFKNTKKSDFVAGQVWGIRGANRYLLDQFHKRADLPATVEALKSLSRRWPQAVAKYIEDKANGPAVIQSLQNEVEGLIAVNPEGGKTARANAVSPLIEAGNVYLPDPRLYPWVEKLLGECESFPNGLHDDQVDAMTQALVKTRNRRYQVVEDNRTEDERIWDDVEAEEQEAKVQKRLEQEQLEMPSVWGFV